MGTSALIDLGVKAASRLGETLEGLASKTGSARQIYEATSYFNKGMRSSEHVFNETAAGKDMFQDMHVYAKNKDTALEKIIEASKPMPQVAAGQPVLHNQPAPNSQMMHKQAANIASAMTFGAYQGSIAAYVKAAGKEVEAKTGSVEIAAAHRQNLSNHIAMLLHDTEEEYKVTKNTKSGPLTKVVSKDEYEAEKTDVSKVKTNIARNKENRSNINTTAVWQAPTGLEKSTQKYFSHTLAAFMAIPHLVTGANNLFGAPLVALAKSMDTMITDFDGAKEIVKGTGIMAESLMRSVHDLEGYRNGHVTSIPQGSIAYYLNKISNSPGFAGSRKYTTILTGVVAHHASAEYAARYAESEDRTADLMLREVYGMDGSDLAEIKKNGGILTESQRARAIYHGTDDKIFLNPQFQRSYYSGKNTFTRLGGMFHNYVASQAKLIGRELSRSLRSNNPAYMANYIAVMGVAFPMAGLMIKNLERVGRGQWPEIHPQTDAENLIGMNGLTPAMKEYIDDIAHVGAFGVAGSFMQGASRNTWANHLIGPLGNMIGTVGSDAINLAISPSKKTLKQASKDALLYSPPTNRMNINKILGNTLFPRKLKKKGSKYSVGREDKKLSKY